MTWVATAIAGSAVLNTITAGQASNAQNAAVGQGIGEQRRQYDTSRADLAPYRSAGRTALQALLVRLGLSPNMNQAIAPNRADYTKSVPVSPIAQQMGPTDRGGVAPSMGAPRPGTWGYGTTAGNAPASTFDQAGYDAAMAKYNAAQSAPPDSTYGSLLKPFTGADLANEPGYQFGLTEGEKAINNLAASRGSYFSGGTAKDLAQYTQDYAGTKYNEAYNRDAADKTRTNALLTGVAGMGLGATNTGVNAGTSSGNAIADLMTQGGNAQAAGLIGQGNAVNAGLSNYLNYQNQGRMIDLLRSRSYGVTPPYSGSGGNYLDI